VRHLNNTAFLVSETPDRSISLTVNVWMHTGSTRFLSVRYACKVR